MDQTPSDRPPTPDQPSPPPDQPPPSPTPVASPQPPDGGPQWAYQPPPPPPALPARPAGVSAAAVILIVLGVLVGLFGALSLLAGAVYPTLSQSPEFRDQFGDVSAALGTLLLVFGLLILAYGILQVVTGIFLLPGRTWARITGLILATLGVLFSLVGVLPGEGNVGGSLVFVALLLAYGYVAWVLASSGSWFSRRL